MEYKIETNVGERTLSIETGKIAKQANGSCVVKYGETVILVTACMAKTPNESLDFFPLTVEYRERMYAAGKIPGGYFKREGRPREKEILSSRLIDRPIRPLFPDNFRNETQIIITVLSYDQVNEPDILGVIGASIALSISDIPFLTPVAAVRIGKVAGHFVINPTISQIQEGSINLIIAGNKDRITMIEGSCDEINEKDLLEALTKAQIEIGRIIEIEEELISKINPVKIEIEEKLKTENLQEKVINLIGDRFKEIANISEKKERNNAYNEIQGSIMNSLLEEFPEKEKEINSYFDDTKKKVMRDKILNENIRLDGRKFDEIRQITCEIGVLPRVHGSALFTRGETQSLGTCTLGTEYDTQKMEELGAELTKSFLLHYNFPPFSVGEVGRMFGPGRREIGHGHLAETALRAIIPSEEIFPYTIRIVSDILESNGSSSMATVCSGSLSLMEAGIPIKSHAAGIAMGLVYNNDDNYVVLSDITGEEDHYADMDFKIAGTTNGISAIQLDTKTTGISLEILSKALEQSKAGIIFILSKMNETISEPKAELSPYAPRLEVLIIEKEKIGLLIGPGGKTIRNIIDTTGAQIDISDDGKVKIFSENLESINETVNIIKSITEDAEPGKLYIGKVKKITDFGAFIEILPGKDGLLHISQISEERIDKVSDVLKVDDEVMVKVIKIDDRGKISLSRKDVPEEHRKINNCK
ncbi:polyribonucleotide nucleotidyltransferase [candidate division WOR-3 bacterium]|jgi:polyribonucleotide nucleotidyltransferase|nr:polyribonucleotide nucleotidyltransferase [candidate division WOR-3 bacterium]